jgi:hypothetical protein
MGLVEIRVTVLKVESSSDLLADVIGHVGDGQSLGERDVLLTKATEEPRASLPQ